MARGVSIVVEWANLSSIELAEARARLQVLKGEICRYAGAVELLFAFPADSDTESQVRGLVDELELYGERLRLGLAPSPRAGYYELKNHGAQRASEEILVFVDCDVFVEPGWLEALVAPFSDPRVEIVCGATHLGPLESTWSRLVALCWIYSLRSADDAVSPVRRFWSHNVAFRRALFVQNPFPDDQRYRGADATLADSLLARGVQIWQAGGARTVHPPPSGTRPFLVRAAHAGADYALGSVLRGERPGLRSSLRSVQGGLGRAVKTTLRCHGQVGLGVAGAVAALGLGTAYWGMAWLSYLRAAVRLRARGSGISAV
jgi:hypothetical protein